jgi:hypothetical protein
MRRQTKTGACDGKYSSILKGLGKVSNHRDIGASEHREIGASGDQNIGTSGNQGIGKSGHLEIGASGNRASEIKSLSCESLEFAVTSKMKQPTERAFLRTARTSNITIAILGSA